MFQVTGFYANNLTNVSLKFYLSYCFYLPLRTWLVSCLVPSLMSQSSQQFVFSCLSELTSDARTYKTG
jgi:hypothetical protein